MDTTRYTKIRAAARRNIAARQTQPAPKPVVQEAAGQDQLVSFESSEALLEALQKGE